MEINVYKDIVPWRDFIRIENIHLDNRMELVNEVILGLSSYVGTSSSTLDMSAVTIDVRHSVNLPQYNKLRTVVEDVLLPKVKQYADDLYGSDQVIKNWNAWSRTTFDGRRENPHFHRSTQIVGIYYLEVMSGDITIIPPRFNYSDGDLELLLGNSDNYTHSPKSGDLLLFPGHMRHYVDWHEHNLRIAVPVDVELAT